MIQPEKALEEAKRPVEAPDLEDKEQIGVGRWPSGENSDGDDVDSVFKYWQKVDAANQAKRAARGSDDETEYLPWEALDKIKVENLIRAEDEKDSREEEVKVNSKEL